MPDRPHILLVEDNPADVELTLRSFAKNNLINVIQVARDGQEALERLFGEGRRLPQLILLDLKLPLFDGIEILRRVKTDPTTKTIPVVILTSSRQEQDVTESYNLGVNSYIVKPVDFEKFNEAVRVIGLYWLLLNESPRVTP